MKLQQVVGFPLCILQQLRAEVTLTLSHTSLKSVQTASFVLGAKWVYSLERFSCSDKLDYWILSFPQVVVFCVFFFLQLLEICMHIFEF